LGVDWNIKEQLAILNRFKYSEELLRFPMEKVEQRQYWFNNGSYGPGDSEYLYSMVRLFKPERIIEVGSGYSTLMMLAAAAQNQKEDKTYNCTITCIEPYSQPWLEELEVKLIRKRVEEIDHAIFEQLEANDILFIDSSHIIKPQGDIIDLYLEVLPTLKPGVFVHSHDIFTPEDYPESWLTQLVRMWNEQYLLEAFLSFNRDFRVIGALCFLLNSYPDALCEKCPVLKLKKTILNSKPGSFWIVRNS
jgi:predicted O-methyltransferase YrrM